MAEDIAHVYFTLDHDTTIGITLTDLTGRTLYTIPAGQYTAGKHDVSMPLQPLTSGIYIININGAIGNKSIKLEVIH